MSSLDKSSGKITSKVLKSITVSNEISYPEWLTFLDSSNHDFKQELVTTYLLGKGYIEFENITSVTLSDAKVFWVVLLNNYESTICEIPVCMLMLKSGIILLKLTKVKTEELCEKNDYTSKNYPEFLFLRYILSSNIFSICLGPCNAYIELKVRSNVDSELLTVLINQDNANIFVTEFQSLYSPELLQKLNPFVNSTFNVENINIDLSKSSVSKQILFGQRVCVSKALHQCQHGILHYIFVTPSHVLLVEERLHSPQIIELDITVKPQFKVCALVSVHTNIKQIHLKDTVSETDYERTDSEPSKEVQIKSDFRPENEELGILYTYGSWLILEFESNILLCLNFSNLKQRNEFLNAFLGARSQR